MENLPGTVIEEGTFIIDECIRTTYHSVVFRASACLGTGKSSKMVFKAYVTGDDWEKAKRNYQLTTGIGYCTPVEMFVEGFDVQGVAVNGLLMKHYETDLFDFYPETLSEIRLYFFQICVAVQKLHDLGLAHTNITPENVLLDNDHALLGGLTLAEDLRDGLYIDKVQGSKPYMGPELAQAMLGMREKEFDGRKLDIWSIGASLFTKLTKQHLVPLDGSWEDIVQLNTDTLRSVLEDAMENFELEPAEMKDAAVDFTFRCLQMDPVHRPTIDDLLEHPFLRDAMPERHMFDQIAEVLQEDSDWDGAVDL